MSETYNNQTNTNFQPYGRISEEMFKLNPSKAIIIAYMDMRKGIPGWLICVGDIVKTTGFGETQVRKVVKEVLSEGGLKRLGNSFYKVVLPQFNELYYTEKVSLTDTKVSLTDTKVSLTDTIQPIIYNLESKTKNIETIINNNIEKNDVETNGKLEVVKETVDNEMTDDWFEKLKKDISNSPTLPVIPIKCVKSVSETNNDWDKL